MYLIALHHFRHSTQDGKVLCMFTQILLSGALDTPHQLFAKTLHFLLTNPLLFRRASNTWPNIWAWVSPSLLLYSCQRVKRRTTNCGCIFPEKYFVPSKERSILEHEVLQDIPLLEVTLDKSCIDVITALACHYIYPPCNAIQGKWVLVSMTNATQSLPGMNVLDSSYNVHLSDRGHLDAL